MRGRTASVTTIFLSALILLAVGPAGISAQERSPPAGATAGGPGAPADTLTLQEALRRAVGQSPRLTRVRADLSADRTARWADWGAFLPTVRGDMTLSRTDFTNFTFLAPEGVSQRLDEPVSDVSQFANQSLSVRWDLLDAGRQITGLREGSSAVEASERRLSATEREVVSEVKVAYFEAFREQRLAEIARDELEGRRRDLVATRRRYEIAAVDRADLLGAELEVQRAELAVLEAEDAAARALRELAVKMGEEEATARHVPALAPPPDAPDAGELEAGTLVRRALETSPELGALEAEIDAHSASLWTARTRYLPTISLSFSTSRSERLGGDDSFFTFDPSNRSQSFGVSVGWQIFDGFDRRGATARASAARERARADRALRRVEIEKEVRDRVEEAERGARRLALLERALEVAEERLELTREAFRLGTAEFFEVQQAIRDVSAARQDLVRERHDHLITWARLERHVGDAAGGGTR